MAIATLSVSAGTESPAVRRARALGVAVRFALGHALLLALGAGAIIILGWTLPLVVERGGEMLGGVLLIVLGATALWGVAAGRVYGHTHVHGQESEPHWHLHIGRRDRHPIPGAHSHIPTFIGAAFAVSSLRALTLLAPFGDRVAAAPLDASRPDWRVRGRDPHLDVAVRRRVRRVDERTRRRSPRSHGRRADGDLVNRAGDVLDPEKLNCENLRVLSRHVPSPGSRAPRPRRARR